MKEVLDFIVLRIQSELDKYNSTNIIPHDLLEGSFNLDDIREKYKQLTPHHQAIADRLIQAYEEGMSNNINSMKTALRLDYASAIANLKTTHKRFKFDQIMNKYRPGINPIKALYYETREMCRKYDPENPHHSWLSALITDKEFSNSVLDALDEDANRLEKIVKRYYVPITKNTTAVPLELFHARQLVKEFVHYKSVFGHAQSWNPDH